MKTILVTGACGYIGSHVLDTLTTIDEVSVIALDAHVDSNRTLSVVKYIECDFLNSNSWEDSLEAVPDICLHLAWRNGFSHNDPSHMIDLSGHFSFLKRLIDMGVPQIAAMGSMHEVGYWEGEISEQTPCNPLSCYGVAKNALRASFLLYARSKGVKAQWLRGYYITGDDQGSQSIFGKLLRADHEGKTSFPFTSGNNKYDFIDVSDLAKQIVACVLQDHVLGVIECCSGVAIPLGERVERYIKDNNLSIRLDYGVYPDRPYDSPAVWGDASKIRAVLGI